MNVTCNAKTYDGNRSYAPDTVIDWPVERMFPTAVEVRVEPAPGTDLVEFWTKYTKDLAARAKSDKIRADRLAGQKNHAEALEHAGRTAERHASAMKSLKATLAQVEGAQANAEADAARRAAEAADLLK